MAWSPFSFFVLVNLLRGFSKVLAGAGSWILYIYYI